MCSAFEYVYLECGQDGLSRVSKQIKRVFGRIKTIRTKKACQIYNAKTAQLFHLTKHLPAKDLLVVECDQLILEKNGFYRKFIPPWISNFAIAIGTGSTREALTRQGYCREHNVESLKTAALSTMRRRGSILVIQGQIIVL